MKILEMHLSSGNSKLKAFFDVETEEGITIKGFKIAEGASGLFVGNPSEKGTNGKWFDRVMMPKDLKEGLTKLALVEYEKCLHSAPSPNDEHAPSF